MQISLRQRLRIREGHLRARYIDGWVHAFAAIRYAMPDARPSRYAIELTPNVVYGPTDTNDHRLDVYVPRRSQRLPIVMYVHGGGFGMLSKDTHRVIAMAIGRRGYVVFNI